MKSFSTVPPELYRSRPRAARLTALGRALLVMGVVLCLGAPVIAGLLYRQSETDRAKREALVHSAVITDGAVARLKRESKNNKRGTVDYQFRVDGQTFHDSAKLPMARWQTLKVGSALPIRYLADDPAVNTPDGVLFRVTPPALPYILAPLSLALGLACVFGLRYQRRLLTEGRAVMATVTSITKRRGQHGESIKNVRYEFPLLSGMKHTGSMQTTSATPVVGSSIVVLYDDENPYRSRPYPLSLVRVADGD